MKRAFTARRVVTCDPNRASEQDPLGVVVNGCVVIEGPEIIWVGTENEFSFETMPMTDAGELLTPALVDAHTHSAWVGSRHDEYALRMSGADYVAISAAGGGIASSRKAVSLASEEEITEVLCKRLARMAGLGVGTVEVKSGYGLVSKEELKLLRAIRVASTRPDLPRVVPTFLALHSLPTEFADKRDFYIDSVRELVSEVARQKLASFVDAYIDLHAFTVSEARAIGEQALSSGLGVRFHVGQFSDVGGAELAAELGAASADHLEIVGDRGLKAMADLHVAAVLLPIASFTLAQSPPPIAKLRNAGLSIVIASDANPGTAPTESLPLAMALAVRLYGLSPSEVILGATRNAALSLRTNKPTGVLAKGATADFTSWDLPHEICLTQPWGTSRARFVWRDGLEIFNASANDS